RSPVRDALVAAGAVAVAPLSELLSGSPSTASATSAAWILGELGAHVAAPAIVSAMRRGALPTSAAMRGLAGAGTMRDVPVVLEFVADPNPTVRGEAINAAMSLLDPTRPDGRVVEPIAAALRDPNCSVQDRARIARLLGRTGAPRAAPVLLELVRARDMTLRLAAMDALGALGPAGSRVDEVLAEAVGSPDATVRLHAAVALSRSGSSRARDSLLKTLDQGDEVDRPAVLAALGGALARAPTEDAVARLRTALDLAAGPERDALIEAIGRAPVASAVRVLTNLSASNEPADRRAVATLLAGHPADAAALAAVRAMLTDADPAVRAQAAWSLGSLGDGGDLLRLDRIARGADGRRGANIDPAIDATAAIGRIAARSRGSELQTAIRSLCALASDPRAYVRANALAGVAAAKARCADGSLERHLLLDDDNEDVRAAAAIAVWSGPAMRGDLAGPSAEDRSTLERCAHSDRSGAVAARCERRPAAASAPAAGEAMLVYVVPDSGTTPRPGCAYAMLLGDGMIRAGTADRRGAVFDPVAPSGEVTLRQLGALSK
ncbi:MAG: HEAT repeat domain-containing protein, partial [Myxococcota bacterium]|nr:HEAT repeat domain-containing protein [Myxococcota bacterium]